MLKYLHQTSNKLRAHSIKSLAPIHKNSRDSRSSVNVALSQERKRKILSDHSTEEALIL